MGNVMTYWLCWAAVVTDSLSVIRAAIGLLVKLLCPSTWSRLMRKWVRILSCMAVVSVSILPLLLG